MAGGIVRFDNSAPVATPQPGGIVTFGRAATPARKAPPPPPGKNWLSPVTDALSAAEKKAVAGMEWAANTPVARGADAVLNADTRASMAAIAGKNAWTGGVMDPAHATETTHEAERRLHLPVLDENDKNANLMQRFGQGVEDFGVETLGSPSTYIPFLGEYKLAKRIGQYGLAAGTALEGARQVGRIPAVAKGFAALADTAGGQKIASLVDRAKGGIVEFHNERKDVTRAGEDETKMHEFAENTAKRQDEVRYVEAVDQMRPALEQYDTVRKRITDQARTVSKIGGDIAQQRMEELGMELEEAKKAALPARELLLQRAFREGTPQVRRLVRKAGYQPTAEEAASEPLNILKGFQDEYLPMHAIDNPNMSEGEKAAAALRNQLRKEPVSYVKQGKASSFTFPKGGGTADTPTADRILDRLITGSRDEHRALKNRNIETGLGLRPLTIAEAQANKTRELIAAAGKRNDFKAVARYSSLLAKQMATADAARETQSRMLQPGAMANAVQQEVPNIDPLLAKRRAESHAVRTGEKEVALKPTAAPVPTKELEGKIKGVNINVRDAELAARSARNTATRATKASDAAIARHQQDIAALGAKPGVKPPPGTILGPDGTVIHVPHTAHTFNEPKLVDPTGAPLSSKPKRTGIFGNAPKTVAQRLEAGVKKPVAANQAFTEARKQGAVLRKEQHEELLRKKQGYNKLVAEMNAHGKELEASINTVPIPPYIRQRLYGAIPDYNKTIWREFSDFQRDALFVVPFAHMKNIALLSALGPGGLKTVMKGIYYAHKLRVSPDDAVLKARVTGLEKAGATEHYIRETEPAYKQIPLVGKPLGDLADKGNGALERWDLGQRLALEDELKSRGITDRATIGGQIRDVLGDYRNQAPAIRELRDRLGASFPAWGLGIVPRAMTKAVRENPRAFEAYARSQRLASDDVTEPTIGGDFDMGSAPEDYAKMFERPDSFFMSPSRLGYPGTLAGFGAAAMRGQPLEYLGETASRLLPGIAIASSATGVPFPSAGGPAVGAPLGLVGAYAQPHKDVQQRTFQLVKLGFKGKMLQDQLRAEGYYPQARP